MFVVVPGGNDKRWARVGSVSMGEHLCFLCFPWPCDLGNGPISTHSTLATTASLFVQYTVALNIECTYRERKLCNIL